MEFSQLLHEFADRIFALAMAEAAAAQRIDELEVRLKVLEVARDTPNATPKEDIR